MSKARVAKLALTAAVGFGALVGQANIAHAGPAPTGGKTVLVNPGPTQPPTYNPGVISNPTTTTTAPPKDKGPQINGDLIAPPVVDPPTDPKPPTGGDGGVVIPNPCKPTTHGPNPCLPKPCGDPGRPPCDDGNPCNDRDADPCHPCGDQVPGGPAAAVVHGDDCPPPCDGDIARMNDEHGHQQGDPDPCDDPCDRPPHNVPRLKSDGCTPPCGDPIPGGPDRTPCPKDPCETRPNDPAPRLKADDCDPCKDQPKRDDSGKPIGTDDHRCDGGGDGGTDGNGGTDGHDGRLPHTGADVATYGMAGLGLIGLGTALRKLGKRQTA